jgi:hypothetical protein
LAQFDASAFGRALPQRVFPVVVLEHRPCRERERCSAAEEFRDLAVQARRFTQHNTEGRAVFPVYVRTRVRLTRWDLVMGVRAASASILALAVAWIASAATDEGGLSWGTRAGRTLPLAPACAALGVWVALAPARARGEALALHSLGRSHMQITASAAVGGALVALASAAAVGVTRGIDVSAFYPTAAHTRTWVWKEGAFEDLSSQTRVSPDGAPERVGTSETRVTPEPIPPFGRLAACLSLGLAGLAFPVLTGHAVVRGRAGAPDADRLADSGMVAVACAGAVAASIVLFQAAAVRLVPALVGAMPPAALAAFTVIRCSADP